MRNAIQEVFSQVHAEDALKGKTVAFLQDKLQEKERIRSVPKLRKIMALCMVLCIALSAGGYAVWQLPVSYISVEVNPSVELVLNPFDRVIDITAYNADGNQIVQNLAVKGKGYLAALQALLTDRAMEQYLTADAVLTFTVSSQKEEKLVEGIQNGCQGVYRSVYHSADKDTVEQAHACGMSVGKYQMYQALAQYDTALTAEDCHDLSMQELRSRLRQYEGGAVGSGNGNGTGNGNRGQGNHMPGGHHGKGNNKE